MRHHDIFLPESMYEIDSTMDFKKIQFINNFKLSLTGIVIRENSRDEYLEVLIGENLTAILPFSQATIYPTHKEDGSISPNIYELVGNKIRAKIISLNNDKIILSRKENMIEALENLKKQTEFELAVITGFSKQSAFFDVGAGIQGRSHTKDFSLIKFHDIKDIGIKKNERVPVKVIEFLDDEMRFNLSRVSALPSHYDHFWEGDRVVATVFNPAPNSNGGHFVLIDNTWGGIVNPSATQIEYGDKIVACVHALSENGLKLNLVEKIDST